MVTTAIIAEFNPFHKGHEYIIKEAKRLTEADCIVIVMSGCFTQRGSAAIAPKHLRAKTALSCGADLIVELPFVYACASAEGFALGAAALLNSLGFVDYLVFGSECGDIKALKETACLLSCESAQFRRTLKENLACGLSYPAAAEKALVACGIQNISLTPNNILAIEYLKALHRIDSAITPLTVRRQGTAYNDNTYRPAKDTDNFISASAFRAAVIGMYAKDTLDAFLFDTLPAPCAQIYAGAFGKMFPVTDDDFFLPLRSLLLTHKDRLTDFSDFPSTLASRFNNCLEKQGNSLFDGGCEAMLLRLKTRNITAARIRRALLHVLCGLSAKDAALAMNCAKTGLLPYARLLAVNETGALALKTHKKTVNAPVINRLKKSASMLDAAGKTLLSFDILSADIYAAAVYGRFGYTLADEYRQDVIRP